MAVKACVLLAVVTGGLALSVATASISNRPAVVPGDIERIAQVVDGSNADIAQLNEKLRLLELEVESLQGALVNLSRELELRPWQGQP